MLVVLFTDSDIVRTSCLVQSCIDACNGRRDLSSTQADFHFVSPSRYGDFIEGPPFL